MQQRKTAASRADEYELCTLLTDFTRGDAAQSNLPLAVSAAESCDLPTGRHAAILLLREPAAQSACQQAIVHFRASAHCGCHRTGLTTFHHKRHPVMNDRGVRRQSHIAKEMVLLHRHLPRLQEIDVVRSLHKADVRNRVNEVRRLTHGASGSHRSPELLRVFELLKDAQSPCNWHATVGITGRGVAHLTYAGVPGPSVVPAVRGFPREFGCDLDHLDSKSRIEPLKHHRQRRGHNPTADQHDIGSVDKTRRHMIRVSAFYRGGIRNISDSGIHVSGSDFR